MLERADKIFGSQSVRLNRSLDPPRRRFWKRILCHTGFYGTSGASHSKGAIVPFRLNLPRLSKEQTVGEPPKLEWVS